MKYNLKRQTQKATEEASAWAYAAWTLPFIALAALVFEYFIGWTDAYNKTIIITAVAFFSISVFWWWWALRKFVVVISAMRDTDESLSDIKRELQKTREAIRDVGNR